MSLPGRPTNPALISFDTSCFEVQGEKVEYSVARSALCAGPAKFGEDREAAEAFAKQVNRTVTVSVSPRLVRVRWTK